MVLFPCPWVADSKVVPLVPGVVPGLAVVLAESPVVGLWRLGPGLLEASVFPGLGPVGCLLLPELPLPVFPNFLVREEDRLVFPLAGR
eukprot:16436642-Heterocapsa_arctica.AAC.1